MKRNAVLPGFLAFIGISMIIAASAPAQDNAAEAVPPVAAEVRVIPAAEYPEGLVHTVVEGDTLWDLSAKHLGSPWVWPELWAQNRFLTNPHFIYPGIKVVIFPPPAKSYALPAAEQEVPKAAAAAQEPATFVPPAPEKAKARPVLRITPAEFVRGGEFLPESPQGIGRIRDGEIDKVAFSEDDVVYLALGKDIPAGQLLGVYRVRGPISVPGTRNRSGYVKFLVGILQVTGKTDGLAKAKVRTSFEDLQRSDLITEEIPSYAPVVINQDGGILESAVISARNENTEMATGDFVFLTHGSDSGVAVGDVFAIQEDRYERARSGGGGEGGQQLRVLVAQVVVIRTLPTSSTAYVENSQQSFARGAHAVRGQSPSH